jgi:ATP-dependent 26S proteasome regulatory subunit
MQQQRLASSTQQQRLASSMHQQQQRRLASSMHQQQQRRLASLTQQQQQQRLASLTQQQQPPPVVLCTVFRVCSMAFLARGFLAAPPGVAAANLQARKVVVSRHQGQQLVCSI